MITFAQTAGVKLKSKIMKKQKFKVNDVCKVIANTGGHEFEIGETVTIIKCYPDADTPHYQCQSKRDYWFLSDEELELLK